MTSKHSSFFNDLSFSRPALSSLNLLCSLSDENKNTSFSKPMTLTTFLKQSNGSGTWMSKVHYSRRTVGSTQKRKVQYKDEVEEETQQQQVQQQQLQQQEQPQQNDYQSDAPQHESLNQGSIQHMRKVYSTMFAASAIATSGSLLGIATGIMSPFLGLAALVPLFALERTDMNSSPTLRMGLASSFALLSGLGIAPIIKYAFLVNPMAIPFSLAITTGIFAAMTIASLMAKKGSFLKMGPPLFGATLGMIALGVGSFFIPASSALYPLVTSTFSYLGVGIFSLFIAYDNQRILSEYEQGERDTLKHGLSMFINIKNLFVHLLSIFSSSRD